MLRKLLRMRIWQGDSPQTFSATNLFRNVPIPVMSISTTSPAFKLGEAPSVPIQITSPGDSVKY